MRAGCMRAVHEITLVDHWIQMGCIGRAEGFTEVEHPMHSPSPADSERLHIAPTGTHVAGSPGSAPLSAYSLGARVVIVSGLRLLRDGLADALTRSAGISVVAAAPDTERARAAIVDHEPNLVLIDIELRDSLALVRAIHDAPRAPRIVVFAVSDSKDALLPYIEAGIDGYVARDGSLADVVAAVESVGRGETIVSPKLAASLFQRLADQRRRREMGSAGSVGPPDLTLRERQILSLVEQGMTNKEIARSLGIELATVKNHVHRVLEKLKVSRRGQAAARARDDKQRRDWA
jgi:two-component system, NarL family, nitrate/nitrite response regulator NarL